MRAILDDRLRASWVIATNAKTSEVSLNRILRRHNDNLWASTPASGEQESHEKELSAAMDVQAILGVAGSGLFNEAAACCYGVGVGVLA